MPTPPSSGIVSSKFGMRNLERQLSITEQEDGSIRYALIDTTGTLDDQVFTVTITPVEG